MAIGEINKNTADQVTTAVYVDIPQEINVERTAINNSVARAQTAITNLMAIETIHAEQLDALVEGSEKEAQWLELKAARDKLVSDAQAYFSALDTVEV